ncbi:MAG: TIGR02757 family protein [Deltaproteobacteria bacterium]|nr:TIGR02757 family protein [Deltaproteobacteria bacterium]MBN2845102.1 TIGR02757 family protein [Deltaproteobacteria bacterium]
MSVTVATEPALKTVLDSLYDQFNQRTFVHPDPLEFLYHYDNPLDREIVGLIASSLAYGRVAQILKSVASVLEKMLPSPSHYIERSTATKITGDFARFKHRFTAGSDLSEMLLGIKAVREKYGSLYTCFKAGFDRDSDTVMPALQKFTEELGGGFDCRKNSLLPEPIRGSACKRLHLFLRWMVRSDEVDTGDWEDISPSKLVVPLDTHMHRICRFIGLTKRRQADMRTALEITKSFRRIVPTDPVRYDFILTRPGIWKYWHR